MRTHPDIDLLMTSLLRDDNRLEVTGEFLPVLLTSSYNVESTKWKTRDFTSTTSTTWTFQKRSFQKTIINVINDNYIDYCIDDYIDNSIDDYNHITVSNIPRLHLYPRLWYPFQILKISVNWILFFIRNDCILILIHLSTFTTYSKHCTLARNKHCRFF